MMRIGGLAGIVLLVALVFASGARAEDGGGISSLATETLTVTGTKGEDTVEVKFAVLNTEDREVTLTPVFKASTDGRVVVKKRGWKPPVIAAGDAVTLSVELEGVGDLTEAATGQLLIKGGKFPAAQSIKVNPPSPDEGWPAKIIFGALVIAFLAWVSTYFRIQDRRARLRLTSNPPKWEFSGWATTLTAFGAVFGAVLGKVTFPEVPSQISNDELVNLNVFFGVLVLIGPFLFAAIDSLPTDKTGTNFTMLIASGFTLWAVVGQLACFGLLAWELLDGNPWAVVLAVATFASIMLACAYYKNTMSKQVAPERDAPEEDEDE